MSRRSIKIPPKEAGSEPSSDVEKYDDVLSSLDTIQTRRKVAASSSGNTENPVKPTTIVMAVVIVVIAATLLLSFGSLPNDSKSDPKLTDGLDFEIRLLDNTTVWLSDYLGKPIILDLFATWCGPCADQIVELQKLQNKHPNVHIISVSIEPNDVISVLDDYALEHSMDWIIGHDFTTKGASRFQVAFIPTMAFFNSQGTRKHLETGVTSEAVMSSWIAAD
ncbi:hypothetical protein CEE45_01910 [Candidatus Heimdallarchaeota archaeon B3_Heim]|nr:MAG: hypothetical protein CEE45_01910 [Candidatus Heimdallarchaeota archaeon B3_Heim]